MIGLTVLGFIIAGGAIAIAMAVGLRLGELEQEYFDTLEALDDIINDFEDRITSIEDAHAPQAAGDAIAHEVTGG
ncbi:MAG TPA: hypothetical protein VKB76_11845 [Ktedonobacterales bacterium]|nr:hypothetical protein [Ktedonobacterales bacterium]